MEELVFILRKTVSCLKKSYNLQFCIVGNLPIKKLESFSLNAFLASFIILSYPAFVFLEIPFISFLFKKSSQSFTPCFHILLSCMKQEEEK